MATSLASLAEESSAVTYHLTIDEKTVNFSGKSVTALAVNGQIPAPVLAFKEGDTATIYVYNNLSVSSSIHWHGLLLPNVQDGVPYLTTPPILPKTTYKYTFPLKHSGTYWYHSHTGLQEQQGVYGAIAIQPKQDDGLVYDSELAVVFSDWTDEKPESVLKNLKSHNEWYNIKRGTGQPLLPSIAKGLLKERWILYKNRMPDMHIADIYYDAFLSNGQKQASYPQFKPGEKVRLRLVNAGASTYFWINSSHSLEVVSADGVDVEPVKIDKLLMAIAETYDILVTIPKSGQVEIQASAMDGSGSTSFYLGQGKKIKAAKIAKPDYFDLMKKTAILHDGAHKGHLIKPYVKIIPAQQSSDDTPENTESKIDHSVHSMQSAAPDLDNPHSQHKSSEPNVTTDFNYDFLKSKVKTTLPKDRSTREIMLNLDANMLRYIWTINGKPLSQDDKILIKKGEVVRIIMNNNTMMHHPMHLHGHFFRVINKQGEYSPLKHTVDIAPFESMTIEFDANEDGDWFFHCHVLYHMQSGMARVVSYGSKRPDILADFPYETLFKDQKFYNWGAIELSSHQAKLEYQISNPENEFLLDVDYGWNNNLEAEIRYERYVSRYFRYIGAINVENTLEDTLDELETTANVGIRYLLLSILDVEVQLDHRLRFGLTLDLEVGLTERLSLHAKYELINDFNLAGTLENNESYEAEHTISTGLEYTASQYLSIVGGYDNRFGLGAGLLWRF